MRPERDVVVFFAREPREVEDNDLDDLLALKDVDAVIIATPEHSRSRLRLIARIEETAVIARILRHVGLPIEIPAPRPAHHDALPRS